MPEKNQKNAGITQKLPACHKKIVTHCIFSGIECDKQAVYGKFYHKMPADAPKKKL